MKYINFRRLTPGHLIPLEEFFYEVYRLGLSTPSEIEGFPPSMKLLAEKYPEVALEFCNINKRAPGPFVQEHRITLDNTDIFVFHRLRYRPTMQHSHQFFEILFVVEGECRNQVERTTLTLRKGDICFLAPNVLHTLEINRHDTIVYAIAVRTSTFKNAFTNICRRHDIVSDFFTHALFPSSSPITPFLLCRTNCEAELMSPLNQMICEQQKQEKFYERVVNLLFELFIAELLRRHELDFSIGELSTNANRQNIITMLSYIQENYKTISLSKAAAFFNCSESYFSRTIKRYTGQNFVDIVKKAKLQKATVLLLEENKTVAEIVEEVGYADHSHFSRVFKAHYGMTPIQYKVAHQQLVET